MATSITPAIPTDRKELVKMLQRASEGDATVLPVVRHILRAPATVELLGGDLARLAEESLIRAVAGDNLAMREALARKCELLRAELAGPAPAPLERLLVQRVVACWLQLHHCDALIAQQADKLTMRQLDYHQRTRDRAHRRYLSAVKALALVRRMAVPVLRLNVVTPAVNRD